MLVAEVDDAEPVAVGVGEHDEVRVVGIAVPIDALGAEGQEPLRLGALLGCTVHVKVEVQPGLVLQRCLAALQRDLRPAPPSGGTSTFAHPPNPSVRSS